MHGCFTRRPAAVGRKDAQSHAESGFTLLEVMIALVLLLIAMTGVALAQLQSLRSASASALRSKALHLAEGQLEAFHAMALNDPQLGIAGTVRDLQYPIDLDPGDTDFTEYYRCWNVQPNTPAVGLTTITVEVRVGDPACNPTSVGVSRLPFARITGIKG